MSTVERRARERAQRRQEILNAARQVFFVHGFHRPTMDDVAAGAEVSKGTIYLYFESKEEILALLLLEGLDLLLDEMETAHEAADLTPEEALCALARAYMRFSQANPSYFRLIMAFDRGRFEDAISRALYEEVLSRSLQGLDLLARTIEAGIEAGTFVVDDPWRAAGSVWAAVNGVLVLMAHPLRQRMLQTDLETMLGVTQDLVIRGLKCGSGSSQPIDGQDTEAQR